MEKASMNEERDLIVGRVVEIGDVAALGKPMTPEKDRTPQDHWLGMPDFQQTKQRPYAQIIVRVENAEQLAELSRRLEQPFTPKTKSAWFPFKSHWGAEKKVWITDES